ncbi:MAG: AAA family ATPase, partial [Ardenticatenales bacterium]|nr:AAA family ATPase [Ardenticatenales bacterium]
MRYCSNCNFANPDDIVLCLNCAAALALVCPICGEEAPAGSKFCGSCGTRLPDVEPLAMRPAEPQPTPTAAAPVNDEEGDPIALREEGIIQAHKKNWEEAETLLQQAAQISLRQADAHSHGMALLELGRLYQRRAEGGNGPEWRTRAIAALQEAEVKFDSIGAAYDLQAVRSVLDHLEQQEPGRKVAPAVKSAPEGEWYQVSVVWLDLNQPQGTEDEALYESLSIIVPPLLSIAQENQGHIIRRQDGLTIIFGAPTPHEDDPVRAMQTAWRILQELRVSLTWTEVPITFRLAVTQGAAVGSQVRQLAQSELILRGQPLDLARRLAEAAPPSSVWVTPEIRSTTEHLFVYEPAASPAGQETTLAQGTTISELRSIRSQPGSARGLFGIQTRLIGREHLLRAMLELSKKLPEGKGGLIWLEGEAGIGKSRLMQEFSKSISATSVLVWRGQCTPQTSQRSFSLFSDLLMDVFDVQPSDSTHQVRERVQKTLEYWPVEAQAAAPYLELLLGVKSSGMGDDNPLDSLEPDQLRQQTFVALRTLLKSMAIQQPVILLLDDLHWIDPLSADLLLFLGYMVSSLPIFFVGAHRPPETGKEEERLQAVKNLYPEQSIHLPLNRLSAQESEVFLSELLLEADLPHKLRRIIIEQSDGNPYYIEEFIRMLIEQGYLTYGETKQWEVAANLRLEELPLPTSLEALIRSRINTLPAELKQLLQYAAAVGRPFTSNLLKFITGLADPQEELFDLEQRGMLRRVPELSEWQFGHRLIESVVYGSMLKAQRKVLHLRVAFALEARWAGFEADHAEELAYHFSQADESAKALSYLILAGERAIARSANEEALSYFQRAADLLASVTETPSILRWRLTVGLGDAYQFLGRYAEATTALLGGLTLAEAGQLADEHRAGLYRRLGRTAQK